MSALNAGALAASLIALAATATAQPTEASPARGAAMACNQPQASGAYMSCALWIDDGLLRRGATGDVIASGTPFSPLPLASVVTGDSAVHYALRYQRYAGTGVRLASIGAVLTLSGVIYGWARGCHDIECSNRSNEIAPLALEVGGLGFSAVSFPFTLIGRRASVRAIWWHNASLGR